MPSVLKGKTVVELFSLSYICHTLLIILFRSYLFIFTFYPFNLSNRVKVKSSIVSVFLFLLVFLINVVVARGCYFIWYKDSL